MIDRLLSYLYNSYDKNPHALIALRVRHADGFAWQVRNRTLIASTEAGAELSSINLLSLSVADLAAHLQVLGCEIVELNADVAHRSAHALIDGVGRQSRSNGDALLIFDSLLWSFLDAYDTELNEAGQLIPKAIEQIDYSTVSGEFLNEWGKYWGIARLPGENDQFYRSRTIHEVKRKRSNPVAISANIKRLTGYDVQVREPWKERLTLNESMLSGNHYFQGAPEYMYNTAQLITHDAIDWNTVLPVAEADRPVGTIYLEPARLFNPVNVRVSDYADLTSISSRTDFYSQSLGIGSSEGLSESLRLSDYSVLHNYKVSIFELHGYWVIGGSEPGDIGYTLTFCQGEVVLSDSDPLGTLQAHLPGYRTLETGFQAALSDLGGLSDYDYSAVRAPIDEWFDDDRNIGAHAYPIDLVLSFASSSGAWSDAILYFDQGHWSGGWDSRQWTPASSGSLVSEY
ncbi:MAG: hypothetical protein IBX56_11510 [Methylomicrobium sp.]|nr:hypothetical protein [Methylomicrobium sp.]